MEKEKTISVILINYNGKQYNDKCIDSILCSTLASHIQIVVADNASTDGSLEELKEKWKGKEQVKILPLDKNYGFSRANNEGIRWSMQQGIEYFLLLNNDTEIAPDAIEHMLKCQKKAGGIVVPKVLYADRKDIIWYAGGSFSPIIRKPQQDGLNRQDQKKFDKSRQCQFANGCALFLSKEVIDKIGFLDERFFLYYEDVEYSMRAAREGVKIWYCAQAVVYHKVNGSTKGNERPENAYYITRNWLLCNHISLSGSRSGKVWFFLFLFYFACNRFAWMVIWAFQGRKDLCMAQLKGVQDFRRNKWGKCNCL